MSYGKRNEDIEQAIAKVDPRLFNRSPISPRECRILLTKIGLLLFTGEKFPTNEATSLFFGISKLFQNKDASLRQMVYLIIKELANTAEDVIMVTSSIMKDTAVGSDVVYRANAIRALCRIIDATNVQGIERLFKTAIVDKVPSVSSAALVSSYHLLPIAKDVVRRWQSETQEAASSSNRSTGFSLGFGAGGAHNTLAASNTNYMTQYHAIGLLYQMRSHDKMALVKMVQQFGAAGVLRSPAALLLLVRLAAKLADEDQGLRKPMVQLLLGWLRHKSEMVNFEACKAICNMRDASDMEITEAVHVLQQFLSSPRAVTKFAALRILHTFASFRPQVVNPCNQDIEPLISNSNRSIATFAITTLLKTGNESSVDRLMKQISGFMSDITDEFKITIVEAIRILCLKFPSKQAGMLAFLSGILRDEGGYEFKRSVVESMFDLIKFVPDSKEDALAHLCEFIEDCEFTKLAVRILHLLGLEGPTTSQPSKYVRYIYNRVVLENAIVRAAAVTALAKFGVGQKDPEVKSSVTVLLTRCLDDVDDEVRDRAALNLRLMSEEEEMANRFIKNDSMYSLPVFEHQLVMYVTSADKSTFTVPFDLSTIPIVTREQADAEDRTKKLTSATPTLKAPSTGPKKVPATGAESLAAASAAAQQHVTRLSTIPDFKPFGALLKSSATAELTESETEYVVTAVKHIFKTHVVLQFDVRNTMAETVAEDVSIIATPEEDEEVTLEELFVIPAPKIAADETGVVYVAFEKKTDAPFPVTSFTNSLKFTNKEIDPSTGEPEDGGYADEYEIEALELNGADYVTPAFSGSFSHVWEQVGANGDEAQETLQLSGVKSIIDATEQLAKALSLQPLDGTDVPVNTTTHTLKLFGKTLTGGKVVAHIKMAFSIKTGVTTKIVARSEEDGVAALIVGIDGVLLRSSTPLPGAKASLRYLQSRNIPFLLLTNGGGKLESARAAQLSNLLDVEIQTNQLIQSHTPFRSLTEDYADKNVLVLGGKNNGKEAKKVLQEYGFNRLITPADILSVFPTVYPWNTTVMPTYQESADHLPTPIPLTPSPSSSPTVRSPPSASSPLQIHLILTLTDPTDWAPEIQLVTDLLLSHAGILGTNSPINGDTSFANSGYQMDGQPPLYFSNPDLLWAAMYHLPRLGQGGFRAALEGVWRAITGVELQCTVLGKPGKVAYGYANEALEVIRRQEADRLGITDVEPLNNVYMVGDNPESDIRGANEFQGGGETSWKSVLVRSGVYRGGPPKYEPNATMAGVGDAVNWALEREGFGSGVV
ncbi:MAG: Coatomer subunit gamma-2 [Vezdaea aestivalis]|nr:MAG: Coatomer subunit gamma-2 [Vezdaea aestivalis]